MKAQDYFKKSSIIVVIFLFLGCTSSVSNVGIGQQTPTGEGDFALSKYVIINNQTLSRRFQIVDIDSRMVNNLMQAQVQIINKYDTDLRFEYKFQWFDNEGFEIAASNEHWTPVLVYGQEVKTLVGLAPKSSATKFKIHIRKEKSIR